MANDVAPVCNLPNIGQVPALQPGRMFPAIPKAQDLPSTLQAINTLTQIVIQLTSPGLPPFKNNLAPYNAGSHTTGTPGILGAAGSDGSAGQKGKDGKKGKEAQNPQWHETNRKTENVKVKGLHDNAEAYLIMRRVNSLTITSNVDGRKTIVWQGNPSFVGTGGVVLEEGQVLTTGGASNALPHIGTTKSSRETVEQNDSFPANSKSAQGTKDRPFQPGLMSDCVGVFWGGGKGFLYVNSNGVFTSKDGEKWGQVSKDGFSANAVAYGRKIWVAATDSGVMSSKDKGKTWKTASGEKFAELVFAGPSLKDDPKEESGAFYALKFDPDADDSGQVWSSSDGSSWSRVYTFEPFVDGPGVLGYIPENLGTGLNTVVLVADQWVQVPTSDTEAGNYTRAAKLVGSDGSLGGPVVYGPVGNAGFDGHQATNVGGGATVSESGTEFISYLESRGEGFGTQSSFIVVNGTVVATSTVTANSSGFFGTDVNGGGFMGAAHGTAWFLGSETTFNGSAEISFEYFVMSSGGSKQVLGGPIGASAVTASFFGNTCGLELKNDGSAFCTVFSLNGNGGLWTNTGSGGWTNTFQSTGGAVGVGKIATGETVKGDGSAG